MFVVMIVAFFDLSDSEFESPGCSSFSKPPMPTTLTPLSHLSIIILLNLLRCAMVTAGFTGRLQRGGWRRVGTRANSKNVVAVSAGETWEGSEEARTTRLFLLFCLLLLFLVHLWEGRPIVSSSLPSLVTLGASDVLEAVRWRLWNSSPTPVKDINRRVRWIHRVVSHSVSAYALLSASNTASFPLARFRFKIFLLALIAFVVYDSIEEIVFETSLPIIVALLVGADETVLESLGDRFVVVTAVAVIPVFLRLRIRFSGGFHHQLRRENVAAISSPSSSDSSSVANELKRLIRRRGRATKYPSHRLLTSTDPEVQATLLVGVTMVVMLLIFTSAANPGSYHNDDPLAAAARQLGQVLSHPKTWGAGCLLSAIAIRRLKFFFTGLEKRMGAFRRWEREDEIQRSRSFAILTMSAGATLVALGVASPPPWVLLGCVFAVVHSVRKGDERGVRGVCGLIRIGMTFGCDLNSGPFLALFTCGRLLNTFESRPYGDIFTDSLIGVGMVLLVVPRERLTAGDTAVMLIFTVCAALFVAFTIQIARFQAFELMRMSHESRVSSGFSANKAGGGG